MGLLIVCGSVDCMWVTQLRMKNIFYIWFPLQIPINELKFILKNISEK